MASRYRTRKRDLTTDFSRYNRRGWGWVGGNQVFSDAYSTETREEFWDSTNPGFFKAKREGLVLPVSPMDKVTKKMVLTPGHFAFKYAVASKPTGGEMLDGYGALFPQSAWSSCINLNAPPPSRTVSEQALLQDALAKAQTDAWDTLTFLAELEKTVEGLQSFYGRWKEFYDRLIRAAQSKRKRFKTSADALTAAWLEARYSFRPLYYDMLSIQKAYSRLTTGVDSPLARGWATSDVGSTSVTRSLTHQSVELCKGSFSPNTFQTLVSDGAAVGGMCSYSLERTVVQRATVGVQVNTRAITMADPLVTAWEMIGLSFVIDWFLTIGDAISAFSPFASGSLRYATYTEIFVDTYRLDFHPVYTIAPNTQLVSFAATPGSVVYSVETVNRRIRQVTPTLEFRPNLNPAKILDLVALGWQMKLRHLTFIGQRR